MKKAQEVIKDLVEEARKDDGFGWFGDPTKDEIFMYLAIKKILERQDEIYSEIEKLNLK